MSNKICTKCKLDFKFACRLKNHMITSSRCQTTIEDTDKYINTLDKKAKSLIICNECNKYFNHKASYLYHTEKSKCGQKQKAKLISNNGGKLTIEEFRKSFYSNSRYIINNINTKIIYVN